MFKLLVFLLPLYFLLPSTNQATRLLIPMDEEQKDHLKSYGVAYWILQNHEEVDWLLNYRGGSFAFRHSQSFENELLVRGVTYKTISDAQYNVLLQQIANPEVNMEVIKLEKAPKIAVYTPKIPQPWDDAVTLVLTYAEIPFEKIYDQEILADILPAFDWLHLHHEDFTGQYGKAGRRHRNQEWFVFQKEESEELAREYGFNKVSQMKLEVAKKIKAYVAGGGFMFAMCSAPETFDVALAANGTDIIDASYDGDGLDHNAQQKLDYSQTFAFQDFKITLQPYDRGFSSIDPLRFERNLSERDDFFNLFTFSAKWDPIPAMLTQNHENTVKGFMGQTTAFRSEYVKPGVTVMGETKIVNEVRYINGALGNGTWTFYGGHDPEDYVHMPGEPPTDLALHPNSPGYRLILNNILFPAAKKKKQKT